MSNKYSASRFSCRSSCLQKYKLAYILGIKIEGREFDVQQKGLAFHKIAEETSIDDTLEQITERGLKTLAILMIKKNIQLKGHFQFSINGGINMLLTW